MNRIAMTMTIPRMTTVMVAMNGHMMILRMRIVTMIQINPKSTKNGLAVEQ